LAVDDHLLEAKYTSPGGDEFIFSWEKVEKQTELKTGVYTFPDKDGAHVQHQGGGVVTFPMTCIFSGDDFFDRADRFEAALLERGTGELQHPVYGIRKVKPTGNIKREDDLVGNANESVVTITFTETITDEETPALDAVTEDEIETEYEDFADTAAADFAESITTENASEELAFQSVLETQTDAISESVGDIATGSGVSGKDKAEFISTRRELKNNIKGLYNE
jgi:prophage DNA circulation protein